MRVGNVSGKPQLVILSSGSDTIVPGLNTLKLQVPNITAEKFTLSLEFSDKWILISEINFTAEPSGETKKKAEPTGETKKSAEPEATTLKPKLNYEPEPGSKSEPGFGSGSEGVHGDVLEEVETSPGILQDIEDLRQDMPGLDKPEKTEKNSFPVNIYIFTLRFRYITYSYIVYIH